MKIFRNMVFSLCVCISIVYLYSVYMGTNPLSPSYKHRYSVSKIVPEGWAFFTRNPREDIYRLFQIKGDVVEEVDMSNNSLNTLMGVSRKNRRVNVEFLRMKYLTNDSMYVKEHLSNWRAMELFEIKEPRGYNYYFLKNGEYLIQREKIIPWIYSKNDYEYDQEIHIARVKFSN